MKNDAYVVRVGNSWQPWQKTVTTFISKNREECLEWIKENLENGQHAYIDLVRCEKC